MMDDLDSYRPYIELQAPYAYALLFRKYGDFGRAQAALENAFVLGHPRWLGERPETRNSPTFVSELAESFGVNGAHENPEPATGLLARSQKLKTLESAIEVLRSFPAEDQLALILLHVEEAPPDRILRWMGKDSEFLDAVRSRLKERLAGWAPSLANREEPELFFLRALRQHRLSTQFSSLVLQRLDQRRIDWSPFVRLAGWGLVLGIPVFLFIARSEEHYFDRYDYDYASRNLAWQLVLLNAIPGDFLLSLFALLQNRYLRFHAPPALARASWGGFTPMLALAAMSGFGLLVSEVLALLVPEASRVLMRSFWPLVHVLWSLLAAALVSVGGYRIVVFHLKGERPGKSGRRIVP